MLDRIGEGIPGAQRRTMFGYAAYFVQGKLAFGLFGDGVCMKLAEEDRAAALRVKGVTEFAPMQGRVMREYVFFGRAALANEARLKRWAEKSAAYTQHVAPKKPSKANA